MGETLHWDPNWKGLDDEGDSGQVYRQVSRQGVEQGSGPISEQLR